MNNKVGGLVAIDPKTGGILSMVSGPNYDPNDLSGPDGSKNFSRMQLDVYTCSTLDPYDVVAAIQEFCPVNVQMKYLDREHDLIELPLEN